MKAIMFLPFLFALIVSCTRGEIAGDEGASPDLPSTVNKTTLLSLVNDVRKKGCQCGDTWYGAAPAIEWNSQLELAAYNHSKDMKENNYFSHTSRGGLDAGDRITAAGYNWTSYGENIGQGYSNEQLVVNGWLKSPGHCRNIMNKLYREMGVAKVGSYWTQVLASRQ